VRLLNFIAEKLRRPPAPPWAEQPRLGSMAVGVTGDEKCGWSVSLFRYGKTTWLFQRRLVGPLSKEIDAVIECRYVANHRNLPRAF